MKELAIFIDSTSKTPAYLQIYEFIKKEISAGNITEGTFLPSSRALAVFLQVSRSTVLMAYDQLLAEGYIDSVPQKGYIVLKMEETFKSIIDDNVNRGEENKSINKYKICFSPNGIETSHFPYNEWRKIAKQVMVPENNGLFNSGDVRGDEGLRKEIAAYLMAARGVRTNPEQIIVGAGNESLLMIIHLILDSQSVVAMENPAYLKSFHIFSGLGRKIIPVDMDSNGMNISELEKSGADVAYVTPSHQYPLGIVMSIGRRMELLTWAKKKAGRYIIEDDYDSEFRYKGKPIPALQGYDTDGKVIYIGTFSKSVSPAIRMSYMVLPSGLYKEYEKTRSYYSNTISRIDQKLMEIFMGSGGFERHLNRMRKIYKSKHDIMLAEIKTWKNTQIYGENAGAHMLVCIDNGMSEEELVDTAEKAGIQVYALSDYYIGSVKKNKPVIILGYARLAGEQIMEGLGILKKVWEL